VRWGARIGILHELTTPLSDKSGHYDAHHTEEEAEEHEDIHANRDSWRLEGLVNGHSYREKWVVVKQRGSAARAGIADPPSAGH
jgi:hypothetical protein